MERPGSGGVYDFVVVGKVEGDQAAALPVQRVEDDQASEAGGNGVGEVGQAALDDEVRFGGGVTAN